MRIRTEGGRMARVTKRGSARKDWGEALWLYGQLRYPPRWLASQGARALHKLPDKGRRRAVKWQSK